MLMSGLRFAEGNHLNQGTKLFAALLRYPLKSITTSYAIAKFTHHCKQLTLDGGFLVKTPELLTQLLLQFKHLSFTLI
jgi:hypothetical protein